MVVGGGLDNKLWLLLDLVDVKLLWFLMAVIFDLVIFSVLFVLMSC